MERLKTISRGTKSKAYNFIKSLLADGADGTDVHNLVTAISDNISADIGGTILIDLIKNADDVHAEVTHHSTWFGPVKFNYFYWIVGDWADYCANTDLRGSFRFGSMADWKKWNKQLDKPLSTAELEKVSQGAAEQLCVFEWWSDALMAKDATDAIDRLYKNVTASIKEEKKKAKK
jgi:hypothetical protein